jgi:hypothetical protein
MKVYVLVGPSGLSRLRLGERSGPDDGLEYHGRQARRGLLFRKGKMSDEISEYHNIYLKYSILHLSLSEKAYII